MNEEGHCAARQGEPSLRDPAVTAHMMANLENMTLDRCPKDEPVEFTTATSLTALQEIFRGECLLMSVKQVNAVLQSLDILRATAYGRLNCFVPIQQFPAEIMEVIFSFAVSTSRGVPSSDSMVFLTSSPNDHYTLISLSHVCRRWREIALSQSNLWSFIAIDSSQRTTIFIDRARAADLRLSSGDGGIPEHRWSTILRTHASRIRELQLDSYHDAFFRRVVCPLPRIRCLMVLSPKQEYYESTDGPGARPNFMEGFSPDGNRFPRLTHLLLWDVESLLTVEDIINFLSNTPCLEVLSVHSKYGVLLQDSYVPPDILPRPVHLPCLRSARFYATGVDELDMLLRQLQLLDHVHILLHDLAFETDDSPSAVLPAPLSLGNAIVQTITGLTIVKGESDIDIVGEGAACGVWLNAYDLHPELMLFDMHTWLPFPAVHTLRICLNDWDLLEDILRHIPTLTHLSITETPELAGYIEFEERMSTVVCDILCSEDPILCPELRTLEVFGDDPVKRAPMYASLAGRRAALGYPLRVVVDLAWYGPDAAKLRPYADELASHPSGVFDTVFNAGGRDRHALRVSESWQDDGKYWTVPQTPRFIPTP